MSAPVCPVSRAVRVDGGGKLSGCWVVNLPAGASDGGRQRFFYDEEHGGSEGACWEATGAAREIEQYLVVAALWQALPAADRDEWRRRFGRDDVAWEMYEDVAHYYAAEGGR